MMKKRLNVEEPRGGFCPYESVAAACEGLPLSAGEAGAPEVDRPWETGCEHRPWE